MTNLKNDLRSTNQKVVEPTAPTMSDTETTPLISPNYIFTMFGSYINTHPQATALNATELTAAPVIIAVKRGATITIHSEYAQNTETPHPTLIVNCIGDSESKRDFIGMIASTQPHDYICRSKLAKYYIRNLSSEKKHLDAHENFMKNSNIILIFGQENIQKTIQHFSPTFGDQFDFYHVQNGENFVPIKDLTIISPDNIQTSVVSKETANNLLDSAVQTLMKAKWVVNAQPLEDDQASCLWIWLTWLLTAISNLCRGFMQEQPMAANAEIEMQALSR